jgi:hypothetical protein
VKDYFIPGHAIRRSVAPGRGACMASDRITVDGMPVGFMYRDVPEASGDSGWCFLAGDESQEYLDDTENLAIYDVNTIANYDPDIVPLLDAPEGSAFARDPESGRLLPDEFPVDLDEA